MEATDTVSKVTASHLLQSLIETLNHRFNHHENNIRLYSRLFDESQISDCSSYLFQIGA